jgi:hypothetical protein
MESIAQPFQITAGAGRWSGSLFCTRIIRDSGLHSMWCLTPSGQVKVFPLSKPYFLSPENVVQPGPQLANFCNWLRFESGTKYLKIWRFEPNGETSFIKQHGWIGVDLDGTLAQYDTWKGVEHIGDPIQPMVNRVHNWLNQGVDVRIFTARVSTRDDSDRDVSAARRRIEEFCIRNFSLRLPITNVKDFGMYELWDDRCIRVTRNLGTVDNTFSGD